MGGRMFGRAARREAAEREAEAAGHTVLRVGPQPEMSGAPGTRGDAAWNPGRMTAICDPADILRGTYPDRSVVVGFDLADQAERNTVVVTVEEDGRWTQAEVDRRRAEMPNMTEFIRQQMAENAAWMVPLPMLMPNRMADADREAIAQASARRVNQMLSDYGWMTGETGDRYTAGDAPDINPGREWWEQARARIADGATPDQIRRELRAEQHRLLATAYVYEPPLPGDDGDTPVRTRRVGEHRRAAAAALGWAADEPTPEEGEATLRAAIDQWRARAYPAAVEAFLDDFNQAHVGGDPAQCPGCQQMLTAMGGRALVAGRVVTSSSRWTQGHGHPGGAFADGYSGDAHAMTFADDDEPLDPESLEFEARMKTLDDEIGAAAARMLADS